MSSVENLVGLLVTLAAFAAVIPLMQQAINTILPFTGQVADLLLISIPVILLLSSVRSALGGDQVR
jgi:hypothetical protein